MFFYFFRYFSLGIKQNQGSYRLYQFLAPNPYLVKPAVTNYNSKYSHPIKLQDSFILHVSFAH